MNTATATTTTTQAMRTTVADYVAETAIAKAVRLAGGVNAAARLVGVSPSAMCHRIKSNHMPMADAIRLELKSGVRVEEMIPTPEFAEWFSYRLQMMAQAANKGRAISS